MASLERLTENKVSALRSYQNSTPVKGIWKAVDCRGRGPLAESRRPAALRRAAEGGGWKSHAG